MGDAILVQQMTSSNESTPTYLSNSIDAPYYSQSITLSYAASWMAAVAIGNSSSIYFTSGGAISDSFPIGSTVTLSIPVAQMSVSTVTDTIYLNINTNHTGMTITADKGYQGYFSLAQRRLYYFYGT